MDVRIILCLVGIIYSRVLSGNVQEMKISDTDPRDLKWNNCNTSSVSIWVNSFNITPPHFRLGTTLTIAFAIDILEVISPPIQTNVSVKMRVAGEWEEMCDILGIRECFVDDLCKKVKKYKMYSCPLKKNIIRSPVFQYIIPQPSFDISGTFNVTTELTDKGKELGCVTVQFCLGDCS